MDGKAQGINTDAPLESRSPGLTNEEAAASSNTLTATTSTGRLFGCWPIHALGDH